MAITSYGYDGPITEPQMARIMPDSGSAQWGVEGAGDWKVTAGSNPGQLNIAPGTGWGPAVVDLSDSIATVTQASLPSSGSRWDLVALRRDWQPPGGASTFVVLQGTPTKQLPAAAAAPGDSSSTQRMVFPGQIEDQPIALVRWDAGYTSPRETVDLRIWAANGGLIVKDELVFTFMTRLGSSVTIGESLWQCRPGLNDMPQWTKLGTFGRIPLFGAGPAHLGSVDPTQDFLIQAGTTVSTSDGAGYAAIDFPKAFPSGVLSVMVNDGDSSIDALRGASIKLTLAGAPDWAAPVTKTRFVYGLVLPNGYRAVNALHRASWIVIGW